MPKLSAIQKPQDTRDLELNFGEDEKGKPVIVKVTVLPDSFTLGRSRRIREAADKNDLAAMSVEMLSVLQTWDVEGDDGEVVPLNQAGVDTLKWETVLAIVNKITEALGAPKGETTSE